jgi:DNA/RNA non-specific endonuclease
MVDNFLKILYNSYIKKRGKQKMNKLTKSIIILAGAIALTGCGQIHPTGYQKIPGVKQEIKEKSKSLYEKAKDKVNDFKNEHSASSNSNNDVESDYDEAKFPNMYQVLGEAEIDESKFSTTYSYSHDELDRTTTAYGLVNYKAVMDSKGWRAEFEPNSEPSGWWKLDTNGKIVMKGKKRVSNNEEVKVKLPTGKIYSGYFYNRSHLIADSLGGRSYKYNVVTGTRQQNVGNNGDGGMQYIEKKVKDYVEQTKNNVYYEVTPVYNSNELVPRYVIVNAKSEDEVINEKVKVFNNASGYEINYSDGSFTKK